MRGESEMNLREAAQQALEALEYLDGYNGWVEVGKEITALRAALAEDRSADAGKTSDHIADANKMLPTINETETVEPVAYVQGYRDGWCVISPVEHVVLPTGMALYMSPPTCQESRQVEPVVEFRGRRNTPEKTSECWGILLCDFMQDPPKGTKLYTAPPKREPLTEKQIESAVCSVYVEKALTRYDIAIARAIERAHGIGGEE